jgi:REP element-mobilizing transposase RayT
LHIVFSTKGRREYFSDTALQAELHNYLGGACRNQGSPSLIIGGVADHVHILCRLSRTCTVSNLVKELKRESSIWLKSKGPLLADFHWQDGYGAFSISPGHVPALRKYIGSQVEHHRRESCQDEFRRLLAKYQIEYDERFVWD